MFSGKEDVSIRGIPLFGMPLFYFKKGRREMNEIKKIEKENIGSKIYEVRGVQVMLDSDLAQLYKCANGTKDINKAVRRNINRFPEDFYFELTKDELKELCSRFQIGTLNESNGRGSNYKYMPHVFTEQGVAMLASVLHTSIAEEVSVNIMRTFVAMRKYISNEIYYNNAILNNHENRLIKLEETFDRMQEQTKISTIFYNGQIYDAYSLLMDILNKANEEIIIVDNYAGKELLDILKDVDKRIILISKNFDEILIKKYREQYENVEFRKMETFHDRFIIIDRTKLYNVGSSFKDLGKKCFAINEMDASKILDHLLSI